MNEEEAIKNILREDRKECNTITHVNSGVFAVSGWDGEKYTLIFYSKADEKNTIRVKRVHTRLLNIVPKQYTPDEIQDLWWGETKELPLVELAMDFDSVVAFLVEEMQKPKSES